MTALCHLPPILAPRAAATVPAPRAVKAHDPDRCACGACRRERVAREDHSLTCSAVLALDALDAALGRLAAGHCEPGVAGCGLCADADGVRYALRYGTSALRGEVIPPPEYEPFDANRERARAGSGAPVGLACVLALYDALDALLDLAEGHCPSWECRACADADGLVYHVRAGIDLLASGFALSVPVLKRDLLSSRRNVARKADGGGLMPHAAREVAGAEEEVASLERLLDQLRDRYAK